MWFALEVPAYAGGSHRKSAEQTWNALSARFQDTKGKFGAAQYGRQKTRKRAGRVSAITSICEIVIVFIVATQEDLSLCVLGAVGEGLVLDFSELNHDERW